VRWWGGYCVCGEGRVVCVCVCMWQWEVGRWRYEWVTDTGSTKPGAQRRPGQRGNCDQGQARVPQPGGSSWGGAHTPLKHTEENTIAVPLLNPSSGPSGPVRAPAHLLHQQLAHKGGQGSPVGVQAAGVGGCTGSRGGWMHRQPGVGGCTGSRVYDGGGAAQQAREHSEAAFRHSESSSGANVLCVRPQAAPWLAACWLAGAGTNALPCLGPALAPSLPPTSLRTPPLTCCVRSTARQSALSAGCAAPVPSPTAA
jgi:hypothetical protein